MMGAQKVSHPWAPHTVFCRSTVYTSSLATGSLVTHHSITQPSSFTMKIPGGKWKDWQVRHSLLDPPLTHR